jgi:DNA invertase Pin-like site-specific DNA recombinase
MIRAFGYLRVSGKSQVDGDGPERQRDAILRFCKNNALPEPVFFSEEAVSGTIEAMDRPAFSAMVDSVDKLRKEDPTVGVCIIVERQDRLARDLIVQELLLLECARLKILVYSADQVGLSDMASADIDPTRKMLRQILGVVAEWEKSVIVRKLRAARDRKRAKTGRCEGPLPYGATPEEKSTRDILVTLHTGGRSFGAIAREANQMGLKTRKGTPWTRGSVYQVVTRREVKP